MLKRIVKQLMSKITINGIVVSTSSKSVVVNNGKIIIDGVDVTPDSKNINISIDGNVEDLKVDVCEKIDIIGRVGSIKTASGDVDIEGDVAGSVQTMSGDVKCGDIGGNVSTMSGDVIHYGIKL